MADSHILRKCIVSEGSSLLTVFLWCSLLSILVSAVFKEVMNERVFVQEEVTKVKANETAVGAMWYSLQRLKQTPNLQTLSYPYSLSQGQSVDILITPNGSQTLQIITTSSVTGRVTSMRRIIVTFDKFQKKVLSWTEA